MSRSVWVLNHFAVPPGEPGGTRHFELFSDLGGWDPVIFAARINPSTRKLQSPHPKFRLICVTGYSTNGTARVLNWISFSAGTIVAAAVTGIRRRPSVVYSSSPHLLAGVVGELLARAVKAPFVFEVRDLWPQVLVAMGQLEETSWLHRVLKAIENHLYERATKIVVLTGGVRSELIGRGIPNDKIVLIPNAADTSFFASGQPRDVARAKYGFNKFTAVYAGAHGPANGLELVLDAAVQLEEAGRHDIEIVLVGDGIERKRLIDTATERSLSNVRFLLPVAKSEMPDLLRAADAGVHCLADVPLFRYGVSPNKIYDYMASGLPVVTNTPGEMTALVTEAKVGVAVLPNDLADGLIAMAHAEPAQLSEWSDAGRRYTEETRSRSAMRERLYRLLTEIAPKPDGAR